MSEEQMKQEYLESQNKQLQELLNKKWEIEKDIDKVCKRMVECPYDDPNFEWVSYDDREEY